MRKLTEDINSKARVAIGGSHMVSGLGIKLDSLEWVGPVNKGGEGFPYTSNGMSFAKFILNLCSSNSVFKFQFCFQRIRSETSPRDNSFIITLGELDTEWIV